MRHEIYRCCTFKDSKMELETRSWAVIRLWKIAITQFFSTIYVHLKSGNVSGIFEEVSRNQPTDFFFWLEFKTVKPWISFQYFFLFSSTWTTSQDIFQVQIYFLGWNFTPSPDEMRMEKCQSAISLEKEMYTFNWFKIVAVFEGPFTPFDQKCTKLYSVYELNLESHSFLLSVSASWHSFVRNKWANSRKMLICSTTIPE